MELMLIPLLKIIFTTIGWVYLFVRFLNFERMQKEVDEKFKGQYSDAGRMWDSILLLLSAWWGVSRFMGRGNLFDYQ